MKNDCSINKHLDMEIAYKKQFCECGTKTQQAFNLGYIEGLEFAKIVVENNLHILEE